MGSESGEVSDLAVLRDRLVPRDAGDPRYLVLATYRRSGGEVRTPVWCAAVAGQLVIRTGRHTGKAKRMRANPRVRFAPSDARGRPRGDWRAARARPLTDPEAIRRAEAALAAKYGWQFHLVGVVNRLAGRRNGPAVYYELMVQEAAQHLLGEHSEVGVAAPTRGRPLALRWLLATVSSVIVNEALRAGAVTVLAVPPAFAPLSRWAVVFWTVVGVTGGATVFAVLLRYALRPVQVFRKVAVVALVLSWIPDLWLLVARPLPATPPAAVGALMLMHAVTAVLTVAVLSGGAAASASAPGRP
jgi:PPOX class probable F420-dependent enzyme